MPTAPGDAKIIQVHSLLEKANDALAQIKINAPHDYATLKDRSLLEEYRQELKIIRNYSPQSATSCLTVVM